MLQQTQYSDNFGQAKILFLEDLVNMESVEREEVIGAGLLPVGAGMLIAGESGVGKSFFRTELAIHLVLGRDFLGLEIPEPRSVLILQSENGGNEESLRLNRMLNGLGVTPDQIPKSLAIATRGFNFRVHTRSGKDSVAIILQEYRPEVVIYDPLSSAHGFDENSNGAMRLVLDNMSNLCALHGCSTIVVHHFNKPSKDQQGVSSSKFRVRGASSISDWADTILCISERRAKEARTVRDLEWVKVRNGVKPPSLVVEWTEDFLSIPYDMAAVRHEVVVSALRAMGGRADSQAQLIDQIAQDLAGNAPSKTAIQRSIRNAVQMGVVGEMASDSHSQKNVYYIK